MTHPDRLELRLARPTDANDVAALHADSWRRHYRGAYSEAFLDGDVLDDRLAVWRSRLQDPDPSSEMIVAEVDGAVVGFAHAVFDQDPAWGTLLENLHVTYGHKRQGIGTRLLALTAQTVVGRAAPGGLFLWVLEQNVAAQAFYEALGGTRAERAPVQPPGGVASRLEGSPAALRYAWPDPSLIWRGR